jgi:hypothetical protein
MMGTQYRLALVTLLAVLPVGTTWGQVFNRNSGSFSSYAQARVDTRYSSRSTILNRPTVSPYLALTNLDSVGNVDASYNYFTQVRPMLQNREQTERQQRSIARLQRDVQSVSSRVRQSSQPGLRATGHPTRFNSYLHYYPTLQR